ncbi:unnamed protein product [Cylindrotheca closterium]|uniref:Uncharacterized protein n=1 Tax=Cylindrotheca closterium TaxID=2856 RepID=A0AAD2CJL0_9STRA|nr:unnamed protein product [Cylindrotheca closterium]
MGNLSNLDTLQLQNNVLSQLPTEIGNLFGLGDLDVSYNAELLSKSPPDELLRLTNFTCESDYNPEDTGVLQDWCGMILDGPSSAPPNELDGDPLQPGDLEGSDQGLGPL